MPVLTRNSQAAATTTTNALDDAQRMKKVLQDILLLPPDDVQYNAHPIVLTFKHHRIEKFNTDFLTLTEGDIKELAYPDPNDNTKMITLGLMNRRLLIILLAFYHNLCANVGGHVNIEKSSRDHFNHFRTSEYDPSEPIRPWKVIIKKTSSARTTTGETELATWKKSVRPNKTDYKEFRDESYWTRSKEQFETTLESHNLSHIVDSTYVVVDNELDQAQRGWLYSVMQTTLKAPMAKTIVTKHLADKDTRAIWKEMCEHYDSSMTAILRSQQISSYLTSTRLHTIGWRGTQTNFILNWNEQARVHNEISQEPYSEAQLVTFLNSCLSGTPNLSPVLTLNRATKRAAGLDPKIKLSEYIALLLEQTQVHDAGNMTETNPRTRRSVNNHEVFFEDGTSTEYEIFKSEVHNEDTPIEKLMVNRTEQGIPRRPRLDADTWRSLSHDDRNAWDTVSDKGKQDIMIYAAKNPSKFINAGTSNGTSKISEKNTRFTSDTRRVNTHEQISQSDTTEKSDPLEGQSPTIEVSTHQVKATENVTYDFDDVLTMATTQTTSKSNPNAHLTINKIMSTPSSFYQRTDYGLEAFVHKVNVSGFEYEVESDGGNDFDYILDMQAEHVDLPSEQITNPNFDDDLIDLGKEKDFLGEVEETTKDAPFGMMTAPFSLVPKPAPTLSYKPSSEQFVSPSYQIDVLTDDNTYDRDRLMLGGLQGSTTTEEVMDPFIPHFKLSPNEQPFYMAPLPPVITEQDQDICYSDEQWKTPKTRRLKNKKKSKVALLSSSSSSNSSPSSKSERSSPNNSVNLDFGKAGSD